MIINDHEIKIINLYGPNNDNIIFYQILTECMQENGEKTFIIGGDFNTLLMKN